MKLTTRSISTSMGIGLGLAISLVACKKSTDATPNQSKLEEATPVYEFKNGTPIPNQYIVVLKNESLQEKVKNLNYPEAQIAVKDAFVAVLNKHQIQTEVVQTYSKVVRGGALQLTPSQLAELKTDPNVLYIEQDRVIQLAPKGKPGGGGGGSPAQSTPYGITRVGGAGNGTGKTVWVIDSGVDLDHPDLNVDVARSVSFLGGGGSSPDDQNGHGTHVAGTIGALNNSIGVVGVAAGANIVAVRVLDRRGSGSISGVIAGVDYVAANGGAGDAANMSLGGGVSPTLDNAVISASQTVKFALAAGNESDDANNHSPARANGNNIFTISAMNSSDVWASFSNYGSAVDYCAPGVGVLSTWKDGGYNTISGTSMASPHVAGILALGNISTSGFVSGDPDGNADPIAHR